MYATQQVRRKNYFHEPKKPKNILNKPKYILGKQKIFECMVVVMMNDDSDAAGEADGRGGQDGGEDRPYTDDQNKIVQCLQIMTDI